MRTEIEGLLYAGVSCLVERESLFPNKKTPRDSVEGLIRSLHPVEADQPLIRLGPEGDGGYLVPDDLEGIEACFSPGVDKVSGFELACVDRGMQAFMADRSVDRPAEQHADFHFVKKHIGPVTNDRLVTLDDWVRDSLPDSTDSDLLLQIDIEGHEYEAFLAASPELMRRFRIIVCEFHRLGFLWRKPFFDLASATFNKILQTHSCVHLHPNNCCGACNHQGLSIPRLLEFTFVRRDRVNEAAFSTSFPHPLDCDNTSRPTIRLPDCWYHNSP